MDYKLSLGMWDCIFAVPCEVVEKYINLADLTQLKVLLWILKNREINFLKASKDLKTSEKDVKNAFEFWSKLGFFKGQIANFSSEKIVFEEKKINKSFKFEKPTGFQIASRMKESDEIKTLMKESEIALGRPISTADSQTLLMLYDNEGLPIDVILMLIEYAKSIGKANTRYIESTGINWARQGIDTIEKAEKKINDLNINNVLWKRFEALIGIEQRFPTAVEEEIILRWYQQWHLKDELIKYAYDICVNSRGKYNIVYMNGILKRWYAKGIITLKQAQEDKNSYKQQIAKKGNTSYNLEDFEKRVLFIND